MRPETEIVGTWHMPTLQPQLLRWSNIPLLLVLYYTCKFMYRLYFSPLSHIPGPKLAAATTLYSFYYNLICQGQYIWEIERMHKQYGPIVRITPTEVHINDPMFIDDIFAGPGKRRDKGQMTINGLGSSPTAIGSRDHDLHKSRRAALNPFFSTRNIRRLEPMVHEVLSNLLQRLEDTKNRSRAGDEVPANLNLLYRAATTDLILDYAFGQGGVCFSREDLNAPYVKAYHELVLTWWYGCFFPWFTHVVRVLPIPVILILTPSLKHFIDSLKASIEKINLIRQTSFDDSGQTTIFHGLLSSSLPESEKTSERLAEEAHVLLGAGSDTAANTMAGITYHLLTDSRILRKLRAELQAAIPKDERERPSFAQLEQLPYLSAVIQEGLRRHPAVAGRQQRVAPTEDLVYTNPETNTSYKLPRGTTMSMTPILLSRLSSIYKNPDEFRPERFIENPGLKKWSLTFSRGTRMCLGMQLAYQEMYIILAGIFLKYDGEGTGERLELYQTDFEDVRMVRDLVTENVREGSLGVRVVVKGS